MPPIDNGKGWIVAMPILPANSHSC